MAVGSPRAESLSYLRDIVMLISQGSIKNTTEYKRYLEDKKNWKYSRQYHYSSCIKDLQLVYTNKKELILTNAGKELANIGKFKGLKEPYGLSEKEKEFFSRHFLINVKYENLIKFLSFFLKTGGDFKNLEQLKADGNIIAFVKKKKDDFNYILDNKQKNYLWLMIKANKEERLLTKSEENEFLWVLKRWCKELAFIDEIQISDNITNVKDIHKKVFFPIKKHLEEYYSLLDFKDMLDILIQKKYKKDYIYIPRLTYDFCTTHFVNVREFHSFLIKLYEKLPHEYHLEKATILNIRRNTAMWGDEYKVYGNYLMVNNFYRDYLVFHKQRNNNG